METIDDAVEVLDTGEIEPRRLFDAIAIASGARRFDVVAELTARLVGLVDPVDRARWQFREAVYSGASALLAQSSLDTLPDDIETARTRVTSWSGSSNAPVHAEVRSVDADLSRLALVLAEGGPAGLASACRRLRAFDRPDLGREAASAALEAQPGDPVSLTTRAAASLDLDDREWAHRDLAEAWPRSKTFHTPNSLARLETMNEHYFEAIKWADVACARDDAGVAGLRSKIKAARLGGLSDVRAAALDELESKGGDTRRKSEMWTDVLLAGELRRMRRYTEAVRLLDPLVAEGYPPARRLLLEIRGEQNRLAA